MNPTQREVVQRNKMEGATCGRILYNLLAQYRATLSYDKQQCFRLRRQILAFPFLLYSLRG